MRLYVKPFLISKRLHVNIFRKNVRKGKFCENYVKTLLRVCFFSIKL